VSILGSDKWSSLLGVISLPGTCGTVTFETERGNEGYLYINGTNPMTLMWGGVNEVMSNPAGGTAIGTPITPGTWGFDRYPAGFCVYGTDRESGTVMVTPSPGMAPALGLMNNSGNDIRYLYVTDDGTTMTLRVGSEANWLAKAAGTVIAAIAQSGARGRYVEGRTVLVDAPSGRAATPPTVAVVVQSGNKSAAIGLMSGDYSGSVAIAYDSSVPGMRYSTVPSWYTWSGVTSFP